MIYFDNAATSFPKPDMVYEEIMRAMKEYGANPGRSGHRLALESSRGIFNTREMISKVFNIKDIMNIIFTFNGTEGLNIGIKGSLKPGDHVITTSMEHNSVLRPIKWLEKFGVENTIVKADNMGRIKVSNIENAIKPNTKLIVVTHMSNLTGTIMPIYEIGQVAKTREITFMVDVAQSAGVCPIDVEKMNIDILAFPGHKGLLGPQGTGGMYISKKLNLPEIYQGGTGSSSHSLIQPEIMPDRYESGTLNAPGIIGLGTGVGYILDRGIDNIKKFGEELTIHFLEEIQKIKDIKIYGPMNIEEQGSVVSLNIGDRDSSEISYILNEKYNIAVRPGMHCAPLAHETIGTMKQGTVRFSFGLFNTHEEIEFSIKALKKIAKEV